MNSEVFAFIEQIKKDIAINSNIVLIEVSGGSCVGKSTIIEEFVNNFDDIQIISQDSYQVGKNFKNKKTSKYKFDDPENFQLDKAYQDIFQLLNNNEITIPIFDLKENTTVGDQKIKPRKVNILEGIYASLPPLNELSKYRLYIEAPYYLRFLRRIARFVNSSQNSDLTIPLKHITASVFKAHKDFVVKQKDTATLVIQVENILPKFVNPIFNEELIIEETLFEILDTKICLGKVKLEQHLTIIQNKEMVYDVIIDNETKEFLKDVNWLEQ
ncbi:MAG: hypothetical protein WC847_00010 [Candidatus Paceibacterota bacterium]|jgi:uridine kinase